MSKIRKMRSFVRDKKLVIEVPLELMKYALENRNSDLTRLHIRSLSKMGKYYAKRILELNSVMERPETDFESLLEDVAILAYEDGVDWLAVEESGGKV